MTRVDESGPAAHETRQYPFVVALDALDRLSLSLGGGKAASLGELLKAGMPVPRGFCVSTAAYALVAATANLEPILATLETTSRSDGRGLKQSAATARRALLAVTIPSALADAVLAAYRELGAGPVAVRSSATAEDLPTASFAGQQETYLNVVGEQALLEAIQRCWASLWTDRAVSYRASNRIDQRQVRLAVVVQQMLQASLAGVMFTANPLTGRRHETVIDVAPGLGEAVVSGAVNPDHFVVRTRSGLIVDRRLGDKRLLIRSLEAGGTEQLERESAGGFCVTDDQVRALAALGERVEAHFGSPQDVEFAIDQAGAIWLTQSRPITTLYPLPAGAPDPDDDLRVYFSFNVAQGVLRPLTPMGIQAWRLFGSAFATLAGRPPSDATRGPGFVAEAAGRLFLDVTPIFRSTLGRRAFLGLMHFAEARSRAAAVPLLTDSRLMARPTAPWQIARAVLPFLARTRLPLTLLGGLIRPALARRRALELGRQLRRLGELPVGASGAEPLDAAERLVLEGVPLIVGRILPVVAGGLLSFGVASLLLRRVATAEERETTRQGLPFNPTTEMDLALWALAERLRREPESARALRQLDPERLGSEFRKGKLPASLQQGLAEFLVDYGHRGVAEIDPGLPRWSEDPTHILGALSNYLRLEDSALAPDQQFRRAAREAESMVRQLSARASRLSPLHGLAVRLLLDRTRALAGLRELPKFYLVQILARMRELLQPVGQELVALDRLDHPDDIFFVSIPEARAGLAGADLRPLVQTRRLDYDRELRRRHLPRLLLSDGTEPQPEPEHDLEPGALRGTPASPGSVTALARVVLDPTGARLEPGEILVAPSTDPGWTPLFLTAGGLVMEMGGGMSHGAVVAREYGIPAVVGVAGAVEAIMTGQVVTVDGTAGLVRLQQPAGAGSRDGAAG